MAARVVVNLKHLASAYEWMQNTRRQTYASNAAALSGLKARSHHNRSTNRSDHCLGKTPKDATPTRLRQLLRRFDGWRFSAVHFALWASIVFFVNLSVTIWYSAANKNTGGDLSEGDCGRIENLNLGLHVVINILSTILLGGSNYCMQCLSAPTRADIDRAHATQTWLDIGIPSYRNLRHISRRRLYLWLLLGLSSIPLHLLYNSAIYASTSTNSYFAFVVDEAVLTDTDCRDCTKNLDDNQARALRILLNGVQQDALDKLDPDSCLKEYVIAFQSDRRNILVVAGDNSTDPKMQVNFYHTHIHDIALADAYSAMDSTRGIEPYDWMCSGLDHNDKIPCANRLAQLKRADVPVPWRMYGQRPVKYCLSERTAPRCKLRFNRDIAIVVTILNFFKAVLMFYTVYFTEDEPLLTIGDAVASFLDRGDLSTYSDGLLSARDCKKGINAYLRPWSGQRWWWKDTTSKRRRFAAFILYATILAVVIGLLVWGVKSDSTYEAMVMSGDFGYNFGTVDTRALISDWNISSKVIPLALLSNLPQILLSFLYFAYNGLFTAMLMGYEWASYAHKRKGLRVSANPTGSQRSTYFLELPYRFGLPLLALSGTLHLVVSQCLFVVSVDFYDALGQPDIGSDRDTTLNRCGYSRYAMLAVFVLGILMIAAVVGIGFIPYKRGMPLVASCSVAISAACHPDHAEGELEALSEQKLQWGVVSTDEDGIGHCAFSSREVGPVVKGCIYA